jgi:hypothetical protein
MRDFPSLPITWMGSGGVVLFGVLLVATGPGLWAETTPGDFQPQRFLDYQLPITSFPVLSVREADSALNPTERVLGVTVGEESRVYPLSMLAGPHREVVNDTLGGKAITAVW